MQKDAIIQGTIESLAFGGQGILKANGLVVFIPFTAPGDVVECRITATKKNFAEGKAIRLIKEGEGRILPRCPYYGICGGCQLQHLKYSQQLACKQKAVSDSLQRIGKVELDSLPGISPATAIWGYRRHITLSLRPLEKGYEAGYIAVDGTTLVPIRECPIFLANGAPLFYQLDAILKKFDSQATNPGRATILKAEEDSFLLLFRFQRLPHNCKTILEEAHSRWPQWAGIAAATTKKVVSVGAATTRVDIDGLTFNFNPAAFIQNHAEQSLNIYRDIVKFAQMPPSARILDLYCGIGISSLLLASKAEKVLGIEGNAEAVGLAKQNAANNKISNAEFIASDVKKGLKGWLRQYNPDLVIVNPPRGGLDKEVVKIIEDNPPKRLLYISCMPPTLARDIGLLCHKSYRLQACHLYDMFPQTSHVETLVELITTVND